MSSKNKLLRWYFSSERAEFHLGEFCDFNDFINTIEFERFSVMYLDSKKKTISCLDEIKQ
jgi:hypothetical protein